MVETKQAHQAIKVFIPFTPEESARFRAFLSGSGRKAGPWVRTLVLKAMDEAERIGDGSEQARNMALVMAEAEAKR